MTARIEERELAEFPPELRLAFEPLDKRAFGLAVGVWAALGVFGVTLHPLVLDSWLLEHVDHLAEAKYSGDSLWLLAQYFRGYDPTTYGGAAIGGLWGLWTGFVMGWFLAFARNLFVAAWLFAIRTREQLAANREFLDHI
ncbi:MAG: hypothetical protein ACKVXR_14130 [Planctomycetota bacterium]